MNPYQVVRDFEAALCKYTDAKYAVTTNSCTMALLLAAKWDVRKFEQGVRKADELRHAEGDFRVALRDRKPMFMVPKRTYVSVPMSIIHAGGKPVFGDFDWLGEYRLAPSPVWDSARLFTNGMYRPGQFQCVSFHASKILGDTQGGAILHDSPEADAWLRKMRFDGRTEGVPPNQDNFTELGYHCYMSNDVAARLMLKLSVLPKYNAPLPNDPYPDLSQFEVFNV